ncbi:conserved hypothetical protein [Candidatus Sulfopaludibacter sp. SbA3]|nr:conserved hypothetical protein [Candidatus Sulfopaludibacter sp. SbA3]
MARGWESKSVEAQIDAAQVHIHSAVLEKTQNPEMLELTRKKETILLSRTRVLRELESAQNPRYKVVLTKALADLEAQLSTIDATSPGSAGSNDLSRSAHS